MSNKLLLGGFLTSFAYLSFKIYQHIVPPSLSSPKQDENYLILQRMKEKFDEGHLRNTPFPAYLEMSGQLRQTKGQLVKEESLCQSLQIQLQKDWNFLLFKVSKLLLQ